MAKAPSFTLWGIPVRIEPLFLVVIALLGFGTGDLTLLATWMVIATASILLHEMGHALAFRRYGRAPSIVLHGFGGETSAAGGLTPGRSIVVSLAGPVGVLVLIGLPAFALWTSGAVDGGYGEAVLAQVLWINIGWSLFNLVPVLPLDGGAVTASVLELVTPARGRRIANVLSILVAGALGLVGLFYGFLFLTLVALWFAGMNVMELGSERRQRAMDEVRLAYRQLLAGDALAAEHAARRALASRLEPDGQLWARELLAWARLEQGDPAGAQAAVGATTPTASLAAALALGAGRTAEGVTSAVWAELNDPVEAVKPFLARACARAGVALEVSSQVRSLRD